MITDVCLMESGWLTRVWLKAVSSTYFFVFGVNFHGVVFTQASGCAVFLSCFMYGVNVCVVCVRCAGAVDSMQAY